MSVNEEKHTQPPISVAWLSEEHGSPGGDEPLDAAFDRLLADTAWNDWLHAHIPVVPPQDESHILYIEDRKSRRIMVRNGGLFCYEPIEVVEAARQRGRGEEHFMELFHALWTRWAEKVGLPAPPLVPQDSSSEGRVT